ncbi:hypothetical protein [Luteolibacter sp. Populi]|uniref:hypothetical protein n=1 Tax=Luteolibacter sp. Populi TaxID=3230487 RepID=UPI0034654B57
MVCLFAVAALASSSCNKTETAAGSGQKEARAASRAKAATDQRQAGPELSKAAEFQGRVDRLQAAELKGLWESLDSAGLRQSEKRDRQCQIIARLTEVGAFDTAMKLVSGFGQGEYRQTLVFALFAKSPEPVAKLLERMKDPAFSQSDRNTLLRSLASNIGAPGGLSKVTELLATKPALAANEANAIGWGIAASIDLGSMGLQMFDNPSMRAAPPEEARANYAAAEAALKAAGDAYPALKEQLFHAFLAQAADVVPFECWKTLTENYEGMSDRGARTGRLQALTEQMFAEDPHQALAAIEGLRGKGEFPLLLREGAVSWAHSDINAVEAWFTDGGNGLAKNEADQVAHGVSRFLAEEARPAEGWKWVGKIADPETRRKAEGQVWQREKEMVSNEAGNNPQQLVESIMSGSSQHAAYWIEIGMNEWVAQDPEAARKWYEAKGPSLTPQQNEAVALSYARLALADGQVEEAARWAGQVVTPKLKNKIESEIKKAGEEGG